jgi:hypothetical protein
MRARDGQKRNAEHFQSQMEGRPALDASKEESVGRKKRLTLFLYFCNYRTMKQPDPLLVPRSAERSAALGAEPRLAILRLLLSDPPTGMIAGEVQEELEIPASMWRKSSRWSTENSSARLCGRKDQTLAETPLDRLVVRRPAVTSRAEKFKRSETDMTKSDKYSAEKTKTGAPTKLRESAEKSQPADREGV